MEAHLQKMRQMIAELEGKGVYYTAQHKAFVVLSSLDASCDTMATSLEVFPEAHLTMEYLCSHLLEEAEQWQVVQHLRGEHSGTSAQQAAAFRRGRQEEAPGILVVQRCYTFSSENHLQRSCTSCRGTPTSDKKPA